MGGGGWLQTWCPRSHDQSSARVGSILVPYLRVREPLPSHGQLFPRLSHANVRRPCAASTDCPGCSHYVKRSGQQHTVEGLDALFVSGRLVYQLSVCCL